MWVLFQIAKLMQVEVLKLVFLGVKCTVLGANGAGKTTTISILTGMLPPSGGGASVRGYDIRTEMAQIRKSLGVCPQFDILWSELTGREHLQIFGRLKVFPLPCCNVDSCCHSIGHSITGAAF